MVDLPALHRLVLALPEAENGSDPQKLAFSVRGKSFAWTYLERVQPKAPRRPRLDVLAVRCTLEKKEMLIAAAPDRFFDDDHYLGYRAVLVRLDAICEDELAGLLADAWAMAAPPAQVKLRDG